MTLEDWRGWPVLSPDARSLVVPVFEEGRGLLALRRIDDAGVVALAGTDGAWGPFFSPSGRSIAFMSNGKLRRLEIAGVSAVPLADLGCCQPMPGGSWNAKGILLFAASFDTALFKVSEAGGAAQAASTLDAARGDAGHRFPQFLPDGKSFLFNVRGREPGLYVGSLDSRDTKMLLPDVVRAFYMDSGFLIFQRGRAVLSVRFDVERLETSGAPIPFVDQVFPIQFSGTATGDVAYRFDGHISAQLAWYARDGSRLAPVGAGRDCTARWRSRRAAGARRSNMAMLCLAAPREASGIWISPPAWFRRSPPTRRSRPTRRGRRTSAGSRSSRRVHGPQFGVRERPGHRARDAALRYPTGLVL